MPKIIFPKTIPTSAGLTEKDISALVEESFSKFDLTGDPEIEIMFVSKKEIADLNKKHRGKDVPTDVLSFPQAKFNTSSPTILGSIVISYETVTEKEEKLTDVIKHGLLHLLGFDHETDEKEWGTAAELIDCKL